jgi:catechol 2,3-dioxygenase-like lactoylglutathione lyase family enzyme
MKRLHIHVSVEKMEESIRFYTSLFGARPVKQKPDYAKWLLDDPRVNFAISTRGSKPGLDHLGIQVDEDTELEEVRQRLKSADMKTLDEGETTCCYGESREDLGNGSVGTPVGGLPENGGRRGFWSGPTWGKFRYGVGRLLWPKYRKTPNVPEGYGRG